jgi:hypothetical protein
MGSVSTINPGVENLLQTLTNLGSPVVSSPAEVSALEKAPASDIVQLSMEATQLEGVEAMFGMPSSPVDMNSATNLEELLTGSAGTSTTPQTEANTLLTSAALTNASPADQLAVNQANLQASEAQGLLGTGTTDGLTNSLFDVMG